MIRIPVNQSELFNLQVQWSHHTQIKIEMCLSSEQFCKSLYNRSNIKLTMPQGTESMHQVPLQRLEMKKQYVFNLRTKGCVVYKGKGRSKKGMSGGPRETFKL